MSNEKQEKASFKKATIKLKPRPIAQSCCSNNEKPTEEVKSSCCCGEKEPPKVELKSSCCCGEKEPPKVEVKSSCCCGEKEPPKVEIKSSCCCGEKEPPKVEVKSSCCCSTKKIDEEERQTYGSCCGGGAEEERQTYGSCCGGGAEEKQTYGSCCGGGETRKKSGIFRHRGLIFLGVSLVSLIVSFVMSKQAHLHDTIWHYLDFGFIAIILCGLPIIKRAILNVKNGKTFMKKITSPLLISIAIVACIVLQVLVWAAPQSGDSHGHSYIFAAGEVAWLMALGSLVSDFTVKKARSGIERLVNLSPVTAKILIDGELVEKPLSQISIGDIVTVLPSDMISVDGQIVGGATSIDEAVMTGESIPVDKTIGDNVFGGTWNKSGAIEVRVTKAKDDMTINKLRRVVEEAAGRKAPISKLADKFASVIIPIAVLLAVFIFLMNYFVMDSGMLQSIVSGVTMLVVFCPCALALATPTAVAAGLGNATKRGVLIKSGGALEVLAKTRTIAFDKTGTLTAGNIVVEKVACYNVSEAELLYYAGSAEIHSEHPIAKAITDYAKKSAELSKPTITTSLIGVGVEAEIDGHKITVRKWDRLEGAEDRFSFAKTEAESLLAAGKTLAACLMDGELIGLIALADSIRDGAKECISGLNDMGIKCAMLTGDNEAVARNISRSIGITEVYSSLMPEDKLSVVEGLKNSGSGLVCMVGDGVNDAPALASADTSIAMGTLGSDIAIETADAALISGDIKKIPAILRLSRSMMTKIKINITISMTINFAAFLLSLFSVLDPVTGALIHNLSSILVVLNSALLLRKK